MYTGVTFNGKIHTWRDWGLIPVRIYIPMPEPKVQEIDIPGGDGSIDLTEINGRPAYNDRSGIELEFDLFGGYTDLYEEYSRFAAEDHGKKVKMVWDDEPDH